MDEVIDQAIWVNSNSLDDVPARGTTISVTFKDGSPDLCGVFQQASLIEEWIVWVIQVGNLTYHLDRKDLVAWGEWFGNACAECDSPVEQMDYLCLKCRTFSMC